MTILPAGADPATPAGSAPHRDAPGAADHAGPTAADIRAHLAQVVSSPDFAASARNKEFLAYVVSEALAGRSEQIKAYSVATRVFGRGSDFDPQLDSIVRIEAGRLRRALERYYLTGGRLDPIRISVPTGGYVPVFEVAAAEGASAQAPASADALGCVRLVAFEHLGADRSGGGLAEMLTRALLVLLVADLRMDVVFPSALSEAEGPPRPDGAVGARFRLTGSASILGGTASADALLIDVGTGRVVWAESLERPVSQEDLPAARREFANALAASLAKAVEQIRSPDTGGASDPRARGKAGESP